MKTYRLYSYHSGSSLFTHQAHSRLTTMNNSKCIIYPNLMKQEQKIVLLLPLVYRYYRLELP